MTDRSRSAITLLVLVAMVVGGVIVGALLLLRPLPSLDVTSSDPTDAATCEARTLESGDTLRARQVTVDVYNASLSSGLADRTRRALERKGFGVGEIANADDAFSRRQLGGIRVGNVTVLTHDESSAVVRLLRKQFEGNVRTAPYPGRDDPDSTAVLLGPNFRDVKKRSKKQVPVRQTTTTCVPAAASAPEL